MEIKIIGKRLVDPEGCCTDATVETIYRIDPKSARIVDFVKAFVHKWAEFGITFGEIVVVKA